MEYYDNWQIIKEQFMDFMSNNKLSYDDTIELYKMIIEDLDDDIKMLEEYKRIEKYERRLA